MSFSVSAAATHELPPALRFLFPVGISVSEQSFDPSGVFVARDEEGVIRGVILMQSMVGALGMAWPPRAESDELAETLVRSGCGWLRDRGVKVCQAFSTAAERPLMAPFSRHGFRHIAQLITLRCAIDGESARSSLEFEVEQPPFSPSCRELLLSTHAATLDCPELNLGRTPDELFSEFREAAPGTTWHLARRDQVPVGIVILAPASTESEVELAYLGVAPSFRGCGLGEILLTFARSEAARRGASSMAVSVDNRNWPALQLYQRSGFVESEQRDVWLAHL